MSSRDGFRLLSPPGGDRHRIKARVSISDQMTVRDNKPRTDTSDADRFVLGQPRKVLQFLAHDAPRSSQAEGFSMAWLTVCKNLAAGAPSIIR